MNKDHNSESLIQNEIFLKKAFSRAAMAGMLSIISGCINILADGIIIGQLIGEDGLTAISLSIPINLGLCVIGSFFVSGTAIEASSAIGSNEMEKAQRYYGATLSLCVLSSIYILRYARTGKNTDSEIPLRGGRIR